MISTRLASQEQSFHWAEGFYSSQVESPDRLPVLTFLPTGFQPRYRYPLVVFFHGRGGSERQIIRFAPRLSRRNYICIGLRGPAPVRHRISGRQGYQWGLTGRDEAYSEEYLFSALDMLQDCYPIHPKRIYLAGFCEGASHAYHLGLAFPEKFAGVIALNGHMPTDVPLLRYPEIRDLRVLIGHGIANSVVPFSQAREDYRRLYIAGLNVKMESYPTTHRIHKSMLREIDQWIMEDVDPWNFED